MKKKKQSIISKLRAELKSAQLSATRWQDSYYGVKEKLSELEEKNRRGQIEEISMLSRKEENYRGEVQRLTEIIRWLVKPSTADLEKRAEIELLKERKRF